MSLPWQQPLDRWKGEVHHQAAQYHEIPGDVARPCTEAIAQPPDITFTGEDGEWRYQTADHVSIDYSKLFEA